jgi:signal transduction histidine kinase
MRLLEHLGKRSRPLLIALGLAFVLLLGAIDYLTGAEISFSIFYLLPISVVAWLVGRAAGIVMSAAGATTWFVADMLAEHVYSHPAIPYWNAIMRLGFFLVVTHTLTGLRASRERQEELGHFIVHDLRSPLGTVMTGLQFLQDTAGETMDTAQRGLVETCLTSCNRMMTLVNSLLDLARLESGHMPVQLREVKVKELVESSLEQVGVWAKAHSVSLAAELEAREEVVWADMTLTMRILVNLLSNAIRFSPAGSEVTVRVAPSDASMLAFSVTDQGCGIPPEWVGKVFDKFAQVEAQKAGRAIGSGLGLTFCRLAVEAQGGRIWLESEVDKGTTVSFTLPAGAQAQHA